MTAVSARGRAVIVALGVVTCCASALAGPAPALGALKAWSFISAPRLRPTRVHVDVSHPGTAPGLIFLDPFQGSALPLVGQPGALISDSRGNPVWFHPVPRKQEAVGFRTQQYRGQSVLTWWQGTIAIPPKYTNIPAGSPEPGARFYVYDRHYRRIKTVFARNGFTADLHEILLTPRGTALFIAAKTVPMDLRPYGGPQNGAIEDSAIQEVDLRTSRLVFQWDMLDHVPLSEAQVKVPPNGVWDPYHMNSLDENAQGQILMSARDTWAIYEISHRSGRVIWQLGGSGATITAAPDARFFWQHDARYRPNGEISLFDDGCCDLPSGKPEHHARALLLRLDPAAHQATVARQYGHQPPLYVPTQGNYQALPNGNVFVGWGQQPYYSEYTGSGKLLYDVTLPKADESYRAFRLRWGGLPSYPPSVAARRRHGRLVLYASWNGATQVASWRILAGATPRTLTGVRRMRRTGFETALPIGAGYQYAKVQALDRRGRVLGASRLIR